MVHEQKYVYAIGSCFFVSFFFQKKTCRPRPGRSAPRQGQGRAAHDALHHAGRTAGRGRWEREELGETPPQKSQELAKMGHKIKRNMDSDTQDDYMLMYAG